MKLIDVIKKATSEGKAVGHFNISNLEAFNAIVKTAKKLNVPVIIGVSEGERDFVGVENAVALVESARKGGAEIFLNADHTYSYVRSVEVIDAGYDAVIIDYASKNKEILQFIKNYLV